MEKLIITIHDVEFEVNPFQFDEIWKHIAQGSGNRNLLLSLKNL